MTVKLTLTFKAGKGTDVKIDVRSKYNLKPTKEEVLASGAFEKVINEYVEFLKKGGKK